MLAAGAVAQAAPGCSSFRPPRVSLPELTGPPGKVNVRWTGAAGLECSHQEQTILIDPYLSRIGKMEMLVGEIKPREEILQAYLKTMPQRPAAIIVGHTHLDHALDVPLLEPELNGPLIGSASLETLLAVQGRPGRVRVCRGGERMELPGGAAVTLIPSRHGLVFLGRVPYPGEIDPAARPPLRARDYRCGAVFIAKLEWRGTVLMHVGSANFIEKELDGHRCDVLFLCLPGWKKTPAYPSRLLHMLKPQVVVPFHHDDFTAALPPSLKAPCLPFQDREGFRARIAETAPHAEVKLLDTFESLAF